MILTAFAIHLSIAAVPPPHSPPLLLVAAETESASPHQCQRSPRRPPPPPPRRGRRHLRLGPGGLRAHEDRYGHCCRKHVRRTPEQMRTRLRRERKLTYVSTFSDMKTAQKVVRETLNQNSRRLYRWQVAGNPGFIEIYGRFNYPIGTYVRRGHPRLYESYRSYFLLVGNRHWPGGFQIITGYPVP